MNLAIFAISFAVGYFLIMAGICFVKNRSSVVAKKQGKNIPFEDSALLDAFAAEMRVTADLKREIQAKDAYISRLEGAVYGKKYPGVTVTDTNF